MGAYLGGCLFQWIRYNENQIYTGIGRCVVIMKVYSPENAGALDSLL